MSWARFLNDAVDVAVLVAVVVVPVALVWLVVIGRQLLAELRDLTAAVDAGTLSGEEQTRDVYGLLHQLGDDVGSIREHIGDLRERSGSVP